VAEVFLGLGSNIERYRHITAALDELDRAFAALQISPVYEAESVGFEGDPFLNLVVSLHCELSLMEFVVWLRRLELSYGRDVQAVKFSARTLDVDILCFGELCGEFLRKEAFPDELGLRGLVLPREEILHNAYVLKPLADLAPGVCHPVTERPYAEHWQTFDGARDGLQRVDFRWRGEWVSQAE
jgi:2-amino-4-hydroxy-6-hydroxymethyldihydropteridine diphosphokinase